MEPVIKSIYLYTFKLKLKQINKFFLSYIVHRIIFQFLLNINDCMFIIVSLFTLNLNLNCKKFPLYQFVMLKSLQYIVYVTYYWLQSAYIYCLAGTHPAYYLTPHKAIQLQNSIQQKVEGDVRI